MLVPLLQELDDSILNDSSLTPAILKQLSATERELGLVFGGRPTCPFLRPHILPRSLYDELARAAQVVAGAVEKVVAQALVRDDLMVSLELTGPEARMARIDPGYGGLCVSSRLDAYAGDSSFKFLEYNAETPAGVRDQKQLEQIVLKLPQVRRLLDSHAHWRPAPHRRLLQALLTAYREWGGTEDHPQIAIVDWKGVATESEFHVLKHYFESEGCPTIICDPGELADDKVLRCGESRIDVVYKRVIIHEFLDRCGVEHPLARAYADGRVCVINSFRTKMAHKKAVFAILSDPAFAHLFTSLEANVLRQCIPWTRRVVDTTTTFDGGDRGLLELIRREQDRFVLKPNDDYGGHGVLLGWETAAADWQQAIAIALQRPYVVQERVPAHQISIPTFTDRVIAAELFVDVNPFLFNNEVEGALIRLSSSSLLNMSAGGGQTALVVLEGM